MFQFYLKIIVASASPQFYAEGTDQGGSYFTNRFIRFFNIKSSFTNETTWEEILEASKQSLWKSQRPYYDVNLVRI